MGGSQLGLEIDEDILGPEPRSKLPWRHQFTRAFQQQGQDPEGFPGESDPLPTLPEFAGPWVGFVFAKPDDSGLRVRGFHQAPPSRNKIRLARPVNYSKYQMVRH